LPSVPYAANPRRWTEGKTMDRSRNNDIVQPYEIPLPKQTRSTRKERLKKGC
jgi:hypothetical protein